MCTESVVLSGSSWGRRVLPWGKEIPWVRSHEEMEAAGSELAAGWCCRAFWGAGRGAGPGGM